METITYIDSLIAMRQAGLPIMPAKKDKSPATPLLRLDEANTRSWKPFINDPPSDDELEEWVSNKCNVAVIMGDNDLDTNSLPLGFNPIECIDFDKKIDTLDKVFEEFIQTLSDNDPDLAQSVYIESTVSGGYHIMYKTKLPYTTQKLCNVVSKGKEVCIIETKSNKGYVLTDPSDGYKRISGDLLNLPVISPIQRDLIISIAMSFNEVAHHSPARDLYTSAANGGTDVGNEYMRRGSHSELLTKHGWRLSSRDSNGKEQWTRPGKDRGVSAIWDGSKLFCFTSSVPSLQQATNYNLFALRTALDFGGVDKDAFKKCVKQLVSEGYAGTKKLKNVTKELAQKGIVNETLADGELGEELPQSKTKGGKKPSHEEFVHIAELEEAIAELYETRYNVITSRVEVSDGKEWVPADDRWVSSIWRQLRHAKFPKLSKQYVNDVIDSDFSKPFHPFREYFNSLPAWDGKDRLEGFASRVQVADNEFARWQVYFRRWAIALVACAIDGKPNHSCIVLQGAQSIGKTTWVESLLPPILKSYINKAHFSPHDKDAKIMTAENLIINLDELESSTRDEVGVLKSLITTASISVRRPYGRRTEIMQRTASFIGSVNNTNFLTDQTGSRRFLVVKAIKIDNSKEVEHDQMFAQALDAYRKGEKYWFDGEEVASITDNNKNYEIVASEEELLLKFFTPYRTAWNFDADSQEHKARLRKEIAAKGSGFGLMTFTEIKAAIMAKVPQVKIFDRTLHQVMINNSFYQIIAKIDNKTKRLYPVIMLHGDEIGREDLDEESQF